MALAKGAKFIADITGPVGPPGAIHRGSLPVNADVNTYTDPGQEGSWTFSGSTGATIKNLPSGVTAGQLLVLPQLGGQIVTSYSTLEPAIYFRGRNALSGSTPFGPWMNLNSNWSIKEPGLIVPGTNLNFWWVPERAGYWEINSTTVAEEIENLPVMLPGKLVNNADKIATQIYMSYGGGFWYRAIANVTTKAWTDWVDLANPPTPGGGGDTEQYALKRQVRLDDARKRSGYKIGTAGKAMVALQFDDYQGMFRDKVLPILREFDVPCTMALAVNWVEGNVSHELAENVPWSTVQGWVVNDGCAAQGHSWSHGVASTPAQLKKEIIDSVDYMESKMTSVVIDDWSMPGTGVASDPYGGYNGKTVHDFTETVAGKMLMSRYAFVFAAKGGYLQPGGGDRYIGQSHGLSEVNTVQEFKDGIQKAIDGKYALATMHHPGWLDRDGYKTTAQLRECIQWLAQQRDAGKLILTTRRALPLFDPSSSWRDNLLPGAFGGNLRGWAGWSLNASGNPATTTSGALSYNLDLLPVNWCRGGTREFHLVVRAGSAATIRVTVSAGSTLNATKDYTLPAGTWVDVRKFFSVPMVGQRTLTFSIERLNGGSVEVQQANAYAA